MKPRPFLVLGNVLGPATGDNDKGLGGRTSGAQDVLNRSLRDEAESDRGLVMKPSATVKGIVDIESEVEVEVVDVCVGAVWLLTLLLLLLI